MIEVELKCPLCAESLMDAKRKIDNRPAITVEIRYGKKKGKLRMSSLYGSYKVEMDIVCPDGKIGDLFCPHCKEGLKGSRNCEICQAPMVAFSLREGGTIQICSRRGCKKHLIEFEDPDLELRTFYEKSGTFYKAH